MTEDELKKPKYQVLGPFEAELGENISRLRKALHITQKKLANELRTHQTTVSRVESGFQNLTPKDLKKICKFFEISMDNLLDGKIEYSQKLRKKKGGRIKDSKYRSYLHSTVREAMPIIAFLNRRSSNVQKTLSQIGVDFLLFLPPDEKISAHCMLDLFRHLVYSERMTQKNFSTLIDQTRIAEAHGPLHELYRGHTSGIKLIKNLVLNSEYYQNNFVLEPFDKSKNEIVLEIKPREHMKDLFDGEDQMVKDFLCKYMREYITNFPKYIGLEPVKLIEEKCQYHGADRCLYLVKAA